MDDHMHGCVYGWLHEWILHAWLCLHIESESKVFSKCAIEESH